DLSKYRTFFVLIQKKRGRHFKVTTLFPCKILKTILLGKQLFARVYLFPSDRFLLHRSHQTFPIFFWPRILPLFVLLRTIARIGTLHSLWFSYTYLQCYLIAELHAFPALAQIQILIGMTRSLLEYF